MKKTGKCANTSLVCVKNSPVKWYRVFSNSKQYKSMKNFNKKLIGKNCFSRVVKLLMVMKLTAILIMVSTFGLLASETYAQSKRLTLKMENAKVEEVLANIQKQSEFYFFVYSEKVIDADRRVTVNLEEQNIETVLKTVFAGTDVAYLINDRLIVLTTPEVLGKVSPAVAQQQPTVSGKVTDESGQPLPGVTVVIKGTTQGTVTDADGEYSISSLPDYATLRFSFVGMRTQEVVVGDQTRINVEMVVDAIGIGRGCGSRVWGSEESELDRGSRCS